MNATTSSAHEGPAASPFRGIPRYGHRPDRPSTGQRALRHPARAVRERAAHDIDRDYPRCFTECYPCSRLTLLPMFPVAQSWRLRVVHREPPFRQHPNKHVPNVARFSPCLLDVSVTPLRAQVTASEGPAVALKICWLEGDDRSLDANVLIRRYLRLYAYTEPASMLEELSFPRSPSGYDS
jgi:hypothetical protein